MLKVLPRMTAAAALFAFPLVACGGGSSASGGCGSASTTSADVVVHAQDSLKFDKDQYTAKAGTITFQYVDDGSLVHTLVVRDKGCKLQVGTRGDTKTGSIDLQAGSYELFCDVPGHESAGMKATLVVS